MNWHVYKIYEQDSSELPMIVPVAPRRLHETPFLHDALIFCEDWLNNSGYDQGYGDRYTILPHSGARGGIISLIPYSLDQLTWASLIRQQTYTVVNYEGHLISVFTTYEGAERYVTEHNKAYDPENKRVLLSIREGTTSY